MNNGVASNFVAKSGVSSLTSHNGPSASSQSSLAAFLRTGSVQPKQNVNSSTNINIPAAISVPLGSQTTVQDRQEVISSTNNNIPLDTVAQQQSLTSGQQRMARPASVNQRVEEDDDIIDITDEFFTRFERLYWSKFEAAIPLGLQSTNISVLKIRGYRNALDRIGG